MRVNFNGSATVVVSLPPPFKVVYLFCLAHLILTTSLSCSFVFGFGPH